MWRRQFGTGTTNNIIVCQKNDSSLLTLWNLHFSSSELGADGTPAGVEENLCKICMDSPIDCVLLECGHMITCTKCGKRMSECPVCRQYVVRAVHVFRS